MTNIDLAAGVIQELVRVGVREFVLCAGARNSPLVHVLDECKTLQIYSFFEERSASFFALGRIAQTRRPVAIITTSGTAVSELLSAAVEGTYSSLPLVMVTADRPKEYRGTGAPQSIEQLGIFSHYSAATFDFDEHTENISFENLDWKKPFHVNVCFKEPLIDAEIPSIDVPESVYNSKKNSDIFGDDILSLEIFLNVNKPLVLVGSLPEKARATVLEFLKKYGAPVYCEGISGLRGHPEINQIEVRSGEKMIHHIFANDLCNSILRIGGIPTTRIWRDLEEKFKSTPVFSISFNHFSGLSRRTEVVSTLRILSNVNIPIVDHAVGKIHAEDVSRVTLLRDLFQKYPLSEQGLVHSLSKRLSSASLYLGNSLPIREWDACATHDLMPDHVVANRGANGIDGQLSTFLGWARSVNENWCLVGDLTALYDLSALWVTSQLEEMKLRIVIMNNGGGQIFSRMFSKEIFLNRHQISFEYWAKMWNWSYQNWNVIPSKFDFEDHQIIEINPSREQTLQFTKEYELLWKR